MKQMIFTMLASKKHTMTFVGVVVALGQEYGLPISEEAVYQVCGLIAVLVGAQGLADASKNKETPSS